MKRKVLSMLLALLMIVSLLPVGAFADESDALAKIGDTYFTSLAEAIASVKNGGTITLLRDIDLGNEAWTPLSRSNIGFTFDGDGHTISNLKVASTSNSAGLFGSIGFSESTTTIRNLTLNNVDVKGASYVGALAGWITGTAVFENITVSGDVKVQATGQNAGAIIGHSAGVLTVNNCHVNANSGSYIKASTTSGGGAGGIVGFAGNEGHQTCAITGCTVKNLAVSGYHRIGGIVGIMQIASGTYKTINVYVNNNSVENVQVTVTGASASTLNNRHDAQAGLIVGATTDNGGRSRHHYYNNSYSGSCSLIANSGSVDVIPTALYGLWTLGAARTMDYGQTGVSWYGSNGNADVIYADGAAGEVTFGGTEYITFLTAYRTGASSAENPFVLHTDVGYSLKATDKIYVKANGNIFYPFAKIGYEVKTTEISDTVTLYELITVGTPVAKIGETDFVSLGDAIDAVNNNTETTIQMLGNTQKNVTVPAAKNIVLDLNGYVIKGTGNGSVITNNGTLEITDSNPNAEHKFTSTSDSPWTWTLNEESGDYTIYGGVITGGANATNGGGINNSGSLTVSGGNIVGNTATYGGGIFNGNTDANPNATLTLANCTIQGNQAEAAGGLYVKYGTATVNEGTAFDSNHAFGGNYACGGAMQIHAKGTVIINDGTFSNNTAAYGGAIRVDQTTSSLTVNGGSFIDNKTLDGQSTYTGQAGGIFVQNGTVVINDIYMNSGNKRAANDVGNALWVANNPSVTVNGGTFEEDVTFWTNSGDYISVTGGRFKEINNSGGFTKQPITGGLFENNKVNKGGTLVDLSDLVPENYVMTDIGNGTWSVDNTTVAAAKAEKIALLISYPASEVTDAIVAQGIAAISAATSVEDVNNAYDNTILAIQAAEQAAAELAQAKADAKARLIEAAGNSPSEEVQAILNEYSSMIDNATSISEVESLADAGVTAINNQIQIESTVLAKLGTFIHNFFDFISKIISRLRSLFSFS